MDDKKKILIMVPVFTSAGGISNYYQVIRNHFTLYVNYFKRGVPNWPHRRGNVAEAFRVCRESWQFFRLLRMERFSLVQTTTSFSSLAVLRDGLFVLIAKTLGIKVIVFFRGWDESFVKRLERRYIVLFRWIYFMADAMIDLASTNKERIISWGYRKQVYLETTIVDPNILNGMTESYIMKKYRNEGKEINLLFLARVEKSKGVYEAISCYQILKEKYQNLTLTIAGGGFELDDVKEYVIQNSILDVHIVGHISGEKKIEQYKRAHIYLFPSHSEGMPNSVVEAMAFGLPIVARLVGGLIDFLQDRKTGFTTYSKRPKVIANLTEKLLIDKKLMLKIALENYRFAQANFLAPVVANRIEKIYRSVLSESRHPIPVSYQATIISNN